MSVLVAGTIAIDDVKTPAAEHKDLLGGSAAYAAISASFFAPTMLLGVVGQDFPEEHVSLLKGRGIDMSGVEFAEGKSFRWSGEYFDDLNTRETREVQLNVIENYRPKLGERQARARVVLLANMTPATQMAVLDQCQSPLFVVADTMDLWINLALEPLKQLLRRIDMLVINDGEAKLLAGTSNLITAGHRLRELGPKYVVIKKGEHGSLLFAADHFFSCGAYPLHEVHDPTGAGDTFVGAIAGYLAKESADGIQFRDLCRAVVHGSVMASFNCEAFSTKKLEALTAKDIDERFAEFVRYTSVI